MIPWHYMVAMGIGAIAAIGMLFMNNRRIPYHQKQSSDYYSPPDAHCAICLNQLSNRSMRYLNCGHALHDDCLKELKKRTNECPTCRAKF